MQHWCVINGIWFETVWNSWSFHHMVGICTKGNDQILNHDWDLPVVFLINTSWHTLLVNKHHQLHLWEYTLTSQSLLGDGCSTKCHCLCLGVVVIMTRIECWWPCQCNRVQHMDSFFLRCEHTSKRCLVIWKNKNKNASIETLFLFTAHFIIQFLRRTFQNW